MLSSVVRKHWMMGTAVAMALIGPTTAVSQPDRPRPGILVGEEKRIRDELDAGERLAEAKRFDDAVRRYQQILVDSGDALVSLGPAEPERFLPARWLVHQRIAALPPEARQAFSQTVEDKVRKSLEKAIATRDTRILEQVVADAFCTSSGERALQMLGDLAFERGDFEVADHYWRMLARYPSVAAEKPAERPERFELVHPDVRSGVALTQAKLILSLLFRGQKLTARTELEIFRKQNAEVKGYLAGRQGRLTDILQSLIDADSPQNARVPGAAISAWQTFAGDESRNSVVSGEMTPYWPDIPTWRSPLPGDQRGKVHRDGDPPLGTGAIARQVAFHPVIAMGCALVADSARIFAYDLQTGELAAKYNHGDLAGLPDSLDLRVPPRTDVCYTLTVVGDRIYARFGVQAMKSSDAKAKSRDLESVIACISINRDEAGSVKLQLRWQLRARTLDTDPIDIFEGAPLVRDGRIYLARTRFDGRQTTVAIECYDAGTADGRNEPPTRRWRQEIWNVEVGNEPRFRHDLLTSAGPNIVYCTQSGAIVALDAVSGRRAWAYRYPIYSGHAVEGVHPHDLCPCIYADGRIYAAPSDSDHILCLDARSGEKIWDDDAGHVVQLLGVSSNRLIVARGGYPQGLRAYATGRIVPKRILWTVPDIGDVATFGRGFLSDRLIFWPTRHGLRVVRQEDGEYLDAGSSSAPMGNLALSDGFLVVAMPTEIWGFVPPRAGVELNREKAATNPASGEGHYQLALALADRGTLDDAIAEFRHCEQVAQDGERMFGWPLADLARHRRHELLLVKAQLLWKKGDESQAKTALREASGADFDPVDRLQAWVLSQQAGDRIYPDFADQMPLRSIRLVTPGGSVSFGDQFVINLLNAEQRRELEKRAAGRSTESTESLGLRILNRDQSRKIKESAQAEERAGRLWQASQLYRQLLDSNFLETGHVGDTSAKQYARDGLARVYDKSGYPSAARITRSLGIDPVIEKQNNGSPKPSISLKDRDVPMPWSTRGKITFPPFREWPLTRHLDANGEDGLPNVEDGRLFFSGSRCVICRSAKDGHELWSRETGHQSRDYWLFAESLIVAGPDGVSRLRRQDGVVVWSCLISPRRSLMTSFKDAIFLKREPWLQSLPFEYFQFAGGRLVFMEGRQRLLALDVETGRLIWEFAAPGATARSVEEGAGISRHFLAAPNCVVLQTLDGDMMSLDAANGRIRFRRPAPLIWPSAPVLIDSRRVAYTQGPILHAIEIESGKESWTYSPASPTSLSGTSPQIRRDGLGLLLVVERNFGWEMERVDADNGMPKLAPVLLGRDPIDLSRSGVADDIYAIHAGNRVLGIQRDGRQLWEVSVPWEASQAWRVQSFCGDLFCFPDGAIPVVADSTLARFLETDGCAVPTWAGFLRSANLLYHGNLRRSFPVLAIDRHDGTKVQRMNFDARGPRAGLILGESATVAVEGSLVQLSQK